MPGIIANYKEVVNTPERRQVLTAITGGQLLVQLSSLPVTLALPSMARSFGTDLETASWIVILNLLVLGSTVLWAPGWVINSAIRRFSLSAP